MSDSELPDSDFDSDFTPLNENAVRLHELYLGWIEAGFPEERAFDLVSTTWLHYLETD